jgi:hypothetical protein
MFGNLTISFEAPVKNNEPFVSFGLDVDIVTFDVVALFTAVPLE